MVAAALAARRHALEIFSTPLNKHYPDSRVLRETSTITPVGFSATSPACPRIHYC
ncbi:hypothetical protein PISMIDRAFT_674201 [Pisolithus microcarpus 441]|uniref:Uncharacterized protein n=1 Tax=Pisolithus microcarpus 441 TaxID=765257 RepID=A0A0D0A753_9AGAM|nr:hypothetical protein PISMIDRAFT_674201 [Pisolithus microcarpus 441]